MKPAAIYEKISGHNFNITYISNNFYLSSVFENPIPHLLLHLLMSCVK